MHILGMSVIQRVFAVFIIFALGHSFREPISSVRLGSRNAALTTLHTSRAVWSTTVASVVSVASPHSPRPQLVRNNALYHSVAQSLPDSPGVDYYDSLLDYSRPVPVSVSADSLSPSADPSPKPSPIINNPVRPSDASPSSPSHSSRDIDIARIFKSDPESASEGLRRTETIERALGPSDKSHASALDGALRRGQELEMEMRFILERNAGQILWTHKTPDEIEYIRSRSRQESRRKVPKHLGRLIEKVFFESRSVHPQHYMWEKRSDREEFERWTQTTSLRAQLEAKRNVAEMWLERPPDMSSVLLPSALIVMDEIVDCPFPQNISDSTPYIEEAMGRLRENAKLMKNEEEKSPGETEKTVEHALRRNLSSPSVVDRVASQTNAV